MYEPQHLQSIGSSSSTGGRPRSNLAMFDRKVSEADTYLQLIIEQTNKIEEKIAGLEDPEEREKYTNLKVQADVSFLQNFYNKILLNYIFFLSIFRRCLIISNTRLSFFKLPR